LFRQLGDRASYEEWLCGGPINLLDENYGRRKVHYKDLLMYGELEIEKQ
jgi:hypothetical protein